MLLAERWDNQADLTGWWMSEKLDGVRAYWDGKQFLSRLGNLYHAPAWFIAGLPDVPLDGELWIDECKLLPGDYNYGAPGASDERIWSETGCTCVLVTSTNDLLR